MIYYQLVLCMLQALVLLGLRGAGYCLQVWVAYNIIALKFHFHLAG